MKKTLVNEKCESIIRLKKYEMCNLSESIIREYLKIVILSRFTTDLKNVFFRNMEVLANL